MASNIPSQEEFKSSETLKPLDRQIIESNLPEIVLNTYDPWKKSDLLVASGASEAKYRRPTRGIVPKSLKDRPRDYRIAKLSVVYDATGLPIPLYDDSSVQTAPGFMGKSNSWTSFLLQNIQIPGSDSVQVLRTFRALHFNFPGSEPKALQVNGLLMNTADFNWHVEFWRNYEAYFKGSRCAELRARVRLVVDDFQYDGFMTNAVANMSADMPNAVSFSFGLLLSQDPVLLTGPSTVTPDSQEKPGSIVLSEYTSNTSKARAAILNSKKQTVDSAEQFVRDVASGIDSASQTIKLGLAQITKSIEGFLAGREIRLPAGYEGVNASTSQPIVAANAADAAQLQRLLDQLTGPGASRVLIADSAKDTLQSVLNFREYLELPEGHFYDNTDEYLEAQDKDPRAVYDLVDEFGLEVDSPEVKAENNKKYVNAVMKKYGVDTKNWGEERSLGVQIAGKLVGAAVSVGAGLLTSVVGQALGESFGGQGSSNSLEALRKNNERQQIEATQVQNAMQALMIKAARDVAAGKSISADSAENILALRNQQIAQAGNISDEALRNRATAQAQKLNYVSAFSDPTSNREALRAAQLTATNSVQIMGLGLGSAALMDSARTESILTQAQADQSAAWVALPRDIQQGLLQNKMFSARSAFASGLPPSEYLSRQALGDAQISAANNPGTLISDVLPKSNLSAEALSLRLRLQARRRLGLEIL